jgi:ATP-dependent Clp protease ATP-binding subunit ClpA
MPQSLTLSTNANQLLANARSLALQLGYNHISAIHIFLGYYTYTLGSNPNFTPTQFAENFPMAQLIPTQLHFNTLLQRYTTAPPNSNSNPIAMSQACKHIIDYSKCIAKVFKSNTVEPHHIILALFKCPKSNIQLLINVTDITYQSLLKYYALKNMIPQKDFTFFQKFKLEYYFNKIN